MRRVRSLLVWLIHCRSLRFPLKYSPPPSRHLWLGAISWTNFCLRPCRLLIWLIIAQMCKRYTAVCLPLFKQRFTCIHDLLHTCMWQRQIREWLSSLTIKGHKIIQKFNNCEEDHYDYITDTSTYLLPIKMTRLYVASHCNPALEGSNVVAENDGVCNITDYKVARVCAIGSAGVCVCVSLKCAM